MKKRSFQLPLSAILRMRPRACVSLCVCVSVSLTLCVSVCVYLSSISFLLFVLFYIWQLLFTIKLRIQSSISSPISIGAIVLDAFERFFSLFLFFSLSNNLIGGGGRKEGRKEGREGGREGGREMAPPRLNEISKRNRNKAKKKKKKKKKEERQKNPKMESNKQIK